MFARLRRDNGAAMFLAIAVVTLVGVLALAAVAAARNAFTGSNLERAQVTAAGAAEAGIDRAYIALQDGSATAGCDTSTGTAMLGPTALPGGAPVGASYTATLQLLDGTGAPSCTNPTQALITSSGTYGGATGLSDASRKWSMQSLARLTAITVPGSGAAIYSASAMNLTNNFDVTSKSGTSDANIFVRQGNLTCSNNQPLTAGSILVASGNFVVSGGCKPLVNADIRVNGDIAASGGNDFNVGGSMYAKGDIVLSGATVAGGVYAGGNISGYSGVNKFTGQSLDFTDLTAASFDFPRLDTNVDWTGVGGFGASATLSACPPSNLSSLGTSKVFVATSCSWSGDLTLGSKDVVIYAKNFDFSKASVTATAPVRLFVIVPWETACSAPSGNGNNVNPGSGNILMDNQSDWSPNVSAFVYTPCTITANNKTNFTGQLFAGQTADIANHFNMIFAPSSIPGITLPGGTPQSSGKYQVNVSWKRDGK